MKRGPGHVRVLAAWMLIAALAPSADAAPRHAKARALERSHAAAASALARARALRAGHGVVTGRELTPALAELSARYEALDPGDAVAALGDGPDLFAGDVGAVLGDVALDGTADLVR